MAATKQTMWFAALIVVMSVGTAGAQEATPQPNDPTAGGQKLDMEQYAQRLVEKAEQHVQDEQWQQAWQLLRRVRSELSTTRYALQHSKRIDALYAQSEDALAKQRFETATTTAERNPTNAKTQLEQLRKDYGDSAYVKANDKAIDALETKVRTTLWPGKEALAGEAAVLSGDRLHLTYRFDKIDELADFVAARQPDLVNGALQLERSHGLVRHKLVVGAKDLFVCSLTGTGFGKIRLVLTGSGTEVENDDVVVEVSASKSKVTCTLGSKRKDAADIRSQRGSASATDPWHVLVARTETGVTVTLKGASTLEPKTANAQLATNVALQFGVETTSGKPHIEELVLTGPLPDAKALEEQAALLPVGVWIPLSETDLSRWKKQGQWQHTAGVISASGPGNHALRLEALEGKHPEHYSLELEVMPGALNTRRRRGRVAWGNILQLVIPAGEQQLLWRFQAYSMEIENPNLTYNGVLPAQKWTKLRIEVDKRYVALYVGSKRAFRIPRNRLASGGGSGPGSFDTFAIVEPPPGSELSLRNIRLKLF